MDSLGTLVARDRLDATCVLETDDDPPRRYDYRRFCTTVWRTGNFLRHLGVRSETTVGVTDRPTPESLFSFLGATLLGARARFSPPPDPDCRVLVAPTPELDAYELPPGGTRVGYGDRPADPADSHFETDVWSENPAFPDTSATGSDDLALEASESTYSHTDLLVAGERVVDAYDLAEGTTVVVGSSLARPETVIAGVVAPLLVGATIRLADGGGICARSGGDETPIDPEIVGVSRP